MKSLLIIPVICLTSTAYAALSGTGPFNCGDPYVSCLGFSIANGTQECQKPRYVSPNCKTGCDCALESTESYKCTCNSGYYSSTRSWSQTQCTCEKCNVSNGTCSDGGGITCNKGYYKSGSSCTRCPASGGTYGTTSGTGATSITECYLPSGTSFSDSYGSGTYTSDCYYSN